MDSATGTGDGSDVSCDPVVVSETDGDTIVGVVVVVVVVVVEVKMVVAMDVVVVDVVVVDAVMVDEVDGSKDSKHSANES